MAKTHKLELALQALRTQLLAITTGNGYDYSVAGVARVSAVPTSPVNRHIYMKLAGVDEGDPPLGFDEIVATVEVAMTLTVTTAIEDACLQAAAMMEAAVMANTTLGGYAYDAKVIPQPPITEPMCMSVITVTFNVRYPYGNPRVEITG